MSTVNYLEKSPDLSSSSDAIPPIQPQPSISIDNASPPRRSAIEQFFDSFFQEKNIRWMLVLGAAIVFGSSLMLVTKQWSQWPVTIQFLTILGYTGAIYFFGELSAKRLGLNATGKVLQGLTLLLLPICFLGLSWLSTRSTWQEIGTTLQVTLLAIPTLGLTWIAATRTMDHWLRGRQTTFVVGYVLLCLAGAMPIAHRPWIAACFAIGTWLVMTVGVVKVNRHVFWLVEEHRAPRVFGFLPIALLGGLFLLVVGTKSFHALPTEWIGLGCVALSGTILTTARSVADVYRQRTGDLVRPLPWNLVAPIFVGITLTIIGSILSFYGFSYHGRTTYAVVPTTFSAAVLMFMVANETRLRTFVWAGLVLAATAYQTTPTLISDIVRQLAAGAAQSLAEEKLPIAFYGLTYLPFIFTASIAFRLLDQRGKTFFSSPIREFITLVSIGLYGLAFTHIKAACLVSVVNFLLFGYLAHLFRDRRYAYVSVLATTVVAATWVPFGNSFGWFQLPLDYALVSLAVLAVGIMTLPIADPKMRRVVAGGGLTLTLGLGVTAVVFIGGNIGNPTNQSQWTAFGLILLSVAVATAKFRHYLLGTAFWLLSIAGVVAWVSVDYRFELDLINILTIVSTVATILVPILVKSLIPTASILDSFRIARKELGIDGDSMTMAFAKRTGTHGKHTSLAFAVPLSDLSQVVATTLVVCFHLPSLVCSQFLFTAFPTPFATTIGLMWILWIGIAFQKRLESALFVAALPLWTTGILLTFLPLGNVRVCLPPAWIVVAATLHLAGRRLESEKLKRLLQLPCSIAGLVLPALVIGLSLVSDLIDVPSSTQAWQSLSILAAAAIYFHEGLATRRRRWFFAAGTVVNIASAMTWVQLGMYDYQLYLVPIGLSVLGLVELLKKEIPASAHDPLRYVGALTILISPVFQIVTGSWWHLFSLMVLSVLVVLMAIGLRIRALVYTGSAFLLADLVAMPIRVSIDNPTFLWIGGLAVGIGVIALAALCERHRETLLARIRNLSTELSTWN